MILTSSAGIYMAIGNVIHPLHNKIIYTAKPQEGKCPDPPRPRVVPLLFSTVEEFLDVVTPLAGRTSGAWTLTSAMVRLFCAYHISDKV
jgi:hypothetical protein